MTHPITPPPELVQQWFKEVSGAPVFVSPTDVHMCTRAAQWGADQELEACCELMDRDFMAGPSDLRAARRPKPPSLKERALQAWACVEAGTDDQTAMAVIRRALEALPE